MKNNVEDKINDIILGTPINPDELNLVCKEGGVGVHDLYKFFGDRLLEALPLVIKKLCS